jgi:hypothetical protein
MESINPNDQGLIILMISAKEGTVVYAPSSIEAASPIGYHCSSWIPNHLQHYHGIVSLSSSYIKL